MISAITRILFDWYLDPTTWELDGSTCNQPILLGGIYCEPAIFQNDSDTMITVYIEEKTLDGLQMLIHYYQTEQRHMETYFDLTNKPIVIRPGFPCTLSFKFGKTIDHRCIYYKSEFDNEIRLDKQSTINLEPLNNDFIIRKFKFNLLWMCCIWTGRWTPTDSSCETVNLPICATSSFKFYVRCNTS